MSKLADARGLNIMFVMERTHLSMLSDIGLRNVKAWCKPTINGKQRLCHKAEFADVHMLKSATQQNVYYYVSHQP